MIGFIHSEMTAGLDTPERLAAIPAGRFGTPEEVADAAMFLVRNAYCNGTALVLDGGLTI